MLFRLRNLKNIYTSESIDLGETWGDPRPVHELAGSDSSLDVVKLKKNETLILAYNDIEESKRYRFVLMKSEYPYGRYNYSKCERIKIIAESDNQDAVFCYPSIIQDSDGLVHLVYVKDYQEICYETFTEKELS